MHASELISEGDVVGTLGAAVVAGIQGRAVRAIAPILGSGVKGNSFTTRNFKISQAGQTPLVIVIAYGVTTENAPTVGSGHGRIYFRFAYPFKYFSPTRETGWWLPRHMRYIYTYKKSYAKAICCCVLTGLKELPTT